MDNSQTNPSLDSNNNVPPVLPPTPTAAMPSDNASFALPPLPETPAQTPAPTPVSEIFPTLTSTTTTTTSEPVASTMPSLPPLSAPMASTTTTTTQMTMPAMPTPSTELPISDMTQVSESLPSKPNSGKKFMALAGSVIAVFLVAGIAASAYFITQRASTKVAVAPTAPTSEPQASSGTSGNCSPLNSVCYSADQSWRGKCYDTSKACVLEEAFCNGCINDYRKVTSTKTCKEFIAEECTGGGGGGTGGVCSSVPNLVVSDPKLGSPCDATNCGGDCGAHTYKCGTLCFQESCGAAACAASPQITYETCTPEKRDLPYGTENNHVWNQPITFAKAGKILPFMRNGSYTGTITLTKSGSPTLTIPFSGAGNKELAPVTVVAGDYNLKVTIVGDQGRDSIGWIRNKSDSVCGPVKTPGAAIDANSKTTGLCGEEVNISALMTLATSKADLTGITANGGSANVQCWGDAYQGDDSTDWDFNDFTLAFGYEKTTPTPTPTLSIVPNCNIDGPVTMVLGETKQYTATYTAAENKGTTGGITQGNIFYSKVLNNVDQKDNNNLLGNPYNKPVTDGGTLTANFTPTAVGKYWLRCRAWNDGISECQPPATAAVGRLTNSLISDCAGPKSEIEVTVTETPARTYGPVCIDVEYTAMTAGAWPIDMANFVDPKLGDEVRLYAMANESQNVKFTVKLDGVIIYDKVQGLVSNPVVTSGTTNRYNYYYQFKIDKPGVYTYEAIAL